ncbi:hypothetical protein AKO1_013311, partial [Acrasis kona]
KKHKTEPTNVLLSDTEQGVGIIEYANKNSTSFYGILKERFTDFIVNEVDYNNKVVHLTDQSVPEQYKSQRTNIKEMSDEEKKVHVEKGFEKLTEAGLDAEFVQSIRDFISKREETESQLITQDSATELPSLVLPSEKDKARRSAIHKAINEHFAHLVISDTAEVNNERHIRLRYLFKNRLLDQSIAQRAPSSAVKFDPRNQNKSWPKDRPDYLHFVLHKENIETVNAISAISDALRVNMKIFSWAGTKDKRAVTVQNVTGYRINAERIEHFNHTKSKNFGTGNIQLGNFSYVDKPLTLGALNGNRFTIVLRDLCLVNNDGQLDRQTQVKPEQLDQIIKQSIQGVNTNGFINYFGMQRFGTNPTTPTSTLGKYLLNQQYEQIATSMLTTRKQENDPVAKAVDIFFKTGNAKEALAKLPKFAAVEKKILSGYKDSNKNHSAAVGALPKSLLSMFVHAYQSYVWNHAVSERIKKYGLVPVAGDLVYAERNARDVNVLEQDQHEEASTVEQPLTQYPTVKILQKDELENFTIFDVVMPMPGSDIEYPEHEINKSYYEKFMKEKDDITPSHFTKCTDYYAYGAYRTIMKRPIDIKYHLKRYADNKKQLVDTDIDKIRGKSCEASLEEQDANGNLVALVIEFTLETSTYATMFLRELLKVPSTVLTANH